MLDDIARRVHELEFADLSEAAQQRLLLSLLCNLSVAVAGVRYVALPEPPAGGRYRLFSGRSTASMQDAAFWNAGVMHARTQDDFDGIGNLHVGTVVLPALMTVLDEGRLSGAAFLGALAAGYMVAVGLSRSASPVTTPRGLRSTCLYSPFGASAAIAKARGATLEHTISALALTTAFNAGQTQTWVDGGDEWQVHVGQGARSGLFTNDLAEAGVQGGAHALDGPAGFFPAVVGRATTFADIARDFDPSVTLEQNSIKRYPVSGICQSVVLACERLSDRLPASSTMTGIRVDMNPFEMRYPGSLNSGPFRAFGDRLMSVAFCTASVLRHRGFRFDDFHTGPEAERDRLAALVQVTDDADRALLSARVTVTTSDGTIMSEDVENSRRDVAIGWDRVDDWAEALWREGGRTPQEYRACRTAVLGLPAASIAQFPL